MKLVIQIPCYNEEGTLGITLDALPKSIPGIDRIERLIIDDGSSDRTVEVARGHGVEHIVRFPKNRGLAKAFVAGLDAALKAGADIIVNTDADNQYCAGDLPSLVRPILLGQSDIVIGTRPIQDIPHFSPVKKVLQKLGSWVVRALSRTPVEDAPSGFRAFSREAAMRMQVFSEYTYTLETIIQAGQKGMAITCVPVRVNGELRPSRLVKSITSYVRRSIITMVRIFVIYRPVRFFFSLGAFVFGAGFLLGCRFLYYFLNGDGQGKIQSVILSASLLGSGVLLFLVGVLADLIATNRKLLEDTNWRLRQIEDRISRTPAGATRARVPEETHAADLVNTDEPAV